MGRNRISIKIQKKSETTIPFKRRKTNINKQKQGIKEPEFYLWNKWKNIFLCGTEWNNIPQVYSNPWDFSKLREYLNDTQSFEEFGIKDFKNIFLFGGTEAQSLPDNSVILVPYILAVVGNIPSPTQVGVTSIQRARESIVPMENFNISWVPFNFEHNTRGKNKHYIAYMDCKKRQSVVKHMEEEEAIEYNYIIPHILAPRVVLADSEPPTNINVRIEFHGKGLQLTYDWEADNLKSYVETLCEEYGISFSDKGKELRDIIISEKEKVLSQFNEEEKQKKQQYYDLPESHQIALKEAKFIKFYPLNEEIANFKNSMINRYYGKADAIV